MKNSLPSKINYKIEKNQESFLDNKYKKTVNVNILLNRVRQENKHDSQKKKIKLISIISILFFTCVFMFGN
jgi:hypothetical protein